MRNRIYDFDAVDVYLDILTDFATGFSAEKNRTALASTNHEAILVLELHPIVQQCINGVVVEERDIVGGLDPDTRPLAFRCRVG